ncbi:MAG: Autotransporter adhesin [Myxococcaceae bacterium]|nr:Autotransporter adhesin [Myxococcaceae bacterium]
MLAAGILGVATLGAACSAANFQVAPTPTSEGGVTADGSATDGATPVDAVSPDVRPTGAYADAVIADKPLGYWRLDDPIGAPSAADSSSGAHQGTCLGSVSFGVSGALATDTSSTSVDLQGGTIAMGDFFDFVGNAPFSIEVWARPAFADAQYRRLLAKESVPASTRDGYGLELTRQGALPANEASIGFSRYVAGAEDRVSTVITIVPETYHHIVVTYDGALIKLWVDGAVRDSMESLKPAKDTLNAFALGGEQAASLYQGHLDEVAVYDHVLPDNRVVAHWAHHTK